MKQFFFLVIIIGVSLGCSKKPNDQNKVISNKRVAITTTDTLPIEPNKFLFNPIDSPITICGITVGYTKDSTVINRFGKGYYIKDMPHGGARFFYDSLKNVTLISIIGVDNFIDNVEYYKGKKLFKPLFLDDYLPKEAYKHTSINENMTNGIPFGISPKIIKTAYGEPTKISEADSLLTYEYFHDFNSKVKPKYELPFSATFEFINDSLVSVIGIMCE